MDGKITIEIKGSAATVLCGMNHVSDVDKLVLMETLGNALELEDHDFMLLGLAHASGIPKPESVKIQFPNFGGMHNGNEG